MADIKIPFKYCRIERAAQFLNCEIEDLLTLGLEDKITLNIMLDSDKSFLIMDGSLQEAEDWRVKLPHSYYCYGAALAISEYSSFKFDILSVDSNDNPTYKPYFKEINDHVFSCRGRAYGLWRLIRNIDELINYKVAYLDSLDFIPCLPPEGNKAIQLIGGLDDGYDEVSDIPNEDISESDYEEEDDSYRITDKDLWITAFDIRRLLNCNGDYYLIDSLENINQLSNSENKLKPVHPVMNRHASNREQILIAAIRFKDEQPNVFRENCLKTDNSINYTEFARQLLARPTFFPSGDSPVKTPEAIMKVLKKAFTSNVK